MRVGRCSTRARARRLFSPGKVRRERRRARRRRGIHLARSAVDVGYARQYFQQRRIQSHSRIFLDKMLPRRGE